jgi:hypothetical protein
MPARRPESRTAGPARQPGQLLKPLLHFQARRLHIVVDDLA